MEPGMRRREKEEKLQGPSWGSCPPRVQLLWGVAPAPEDPASRWPPMAHKELWGDIAVKGETLLDRTKGATRGPREAVPNAVRGAAGWVGGHANRTI